MTTDAMEAAARTPALTKAHAAGMRANLTWTRYTEKQSLDLLTHYLPAAVQAYLTARLPDLEAIRERESKATKGPWTCESHSGWAQPYVSVAAPALGPSHGGSDAPRNVLRAIDGQDNEGRELIGGASSTVGKYELEIDNCQFIAHARTDIPTLLDMIASLREREKKAGEAINELIEFIRKVPHHECLPFKEWHCGQHGLLDKYAPDWHDTIARVALTKEKTDGP